MCRLGYEVVVPRTHRFYGVMLTDIERREFLKLRLPRWSKPPF
ncbi:hypothetical protein LINPERHAP2_LOCUS39741 [Linum perenne]